MRFVQLYINGQIWDNHTALAADLKAACDRTDQPIAALLHDLKQRGLLDSTLVVWGGEFGRLPIAQLPPDKDERKAGRDHNKNAFCTWMAGGGVKGGTTYGATDELGLAAVEDRVSVPDWHATILHLLGLHHDQLFVEQNGLKEKLTGVNEAQRRQGDFGMNKSSCVGGDPARSVPCAGGGPSLMTMSSSSGAGLEGVPSFRR